MIFTIGKKSAYDKALSKNGDVTKLGKIEPGGKDPVGNIYENGYEGGAVFETEMKARIYLSLATDCEGYDVYGVNADWEKDTYQAEPEEPFRSLLRNAKLIKLK